MQGSTERLTTWGMFAAVMFLIVGILNVIAGVSALANESYFSERELLTADLAFWGWTWLILGAIQLFISYLVFNRSQSGIVAGMVLAGLGVVVHLLAIGAYPLWSIIIMALDVLVIYGLVTELDEIG